MVESEQEIKFPNYAKLRGAPEIFQDLFSGRFRKSGDDLVVEGGAYEKALSVPLMRCGPKYELRLSDGRFARQLVQSHVSDGVWRYQKRAASRITNPVPDSRYGILSEIEVTRATIELATSPDELSTQLADAFARMRKHFPVTHVIPVSIDFNRAQRWFTLVKMAFLINEFDLPTTQKLLKENKAFESIEISATEPLDWVDSMSRSARVHFSLPLHFMGCTWHLICDNGFIDLSAVRALDGLSGVISNDLPPLTDQIFHQGLMNISDIDGDRIWEFFRVLAQGVNGTISYLIDSRNFDSQTGSADFLKQIQAASAFRLFFADLAAMNYSSSFYNGSSYAFSALDKLANLRKWLNTANSDSDEGLIMQALASETQSNESADRVSGFMHKTGYDRLAKIWGDAIRKSGRDLRQELSEQIAGAEKDEIGALRRLRDQRNVRHGTFLKHNRFRDMFLGNRGAISPLLASLPYWLALDLISGPKGFLEFVPQPKLREGAESV